MSDPITLRLLDIYRIGLGPSSSHTVGPLRAAAAFRESCLDRGLLPDRIEVRLLGSLSATGRGHSTDKAVLAGLHGWDPETCDVDRFQTLMDAPSIATWGDGSVTLNITSGGAVRTTNGWIGNGSDSTSLVTVDGIGSTWTSSEWLWIGNYGSGTFHVTGGGFRIECPDSSCSIVTASYRERCIVGYG